MLEAKEHENNIFLTLTYAPEHIPTNITQAEKTGESKNIIVNSETGEIQEIPTLVKEDISKFMKDLRRYYEYHYNHTGIRFYGCGEYGENTDRPHYHLIIYNLPVFDLEPYFVNKEYQQVWKSDTIQKIWGKGIISIGDVTYQSAAYVARYILKKQKGPNKIDLHREEEFTQMSRKPGIGQSYFEKNKEEIYKLDELIVPVRAGKTAALHPPEYFDRKLDEENPEKLSEIKKARREKAQLNRERKQLHTTLSPDQQLRVAERNMIARANTLKRGLKEEI